MLANSIRHFITTTSDKWTIVIVATVDKRLDL